MSRFSRVGYGIRSCLVFPSFEFELKTSTLSRRYGWYVVGVTVLNQSVTVGILIYSFALFVVPWIGAFETRRSDIMLAIFLLQIGVGVVSPLCGSLMERFSIRWLSVIGISSMALGFILLSQASALWQVIVIYALILPFANVLAGTLAAQTLVTRWFEKKRGVAIGVSASGTSLGGFIFPPIVANLIIGYGWQQTALIIAVAAVVLTLPASWWILGREPPVTVPKGSVGHTTSVRFILTRRAFWIPVISFIPINASFSGIQFHIGAYVNDMGLSQSLAATLISIMSIGMVVGKFVYGGLGDRLDHRFLYASMAIALSIALALYASNPTKEALILAAIFQGLATGGVLPLLGLIYSTRFDVTSFSRVMGFVNLFVFFGSFGALVSGWVFDATGSYDWAFYGLLFLLFPSALLMVWLPKEVQLKNNTSSY